MDDYQKLVAAEVSRRMGELVVENTNLRVQCELLRLELNKYKPAEAAKSDEDELFEDKTK